MLLSARTAHFSAGTFRQKAPAVIGLGRPLPSVHRSQLLPCSPAPTPAMQLSNAAAIIPRAVSSASSSASQESGARGGLKVLVGLMVAALLVAGYFVLQAPTALLCAQGSIALTIANSCNLPAAIYTATRQQAWAAAAGLVMLVVTALGPLLSNGAATATPAPAPAAAPAPPAPSPEDTAKVIKAAVSSLPPAPAPPKPAPVPAPTKTTVTAPAPAAVAPPKPASPAPTPAHVVPPKVEPPKPVVVAQAPKPKPEAAPAPAPVAAAKPSAPAPPPPVKAPEVPKTAPAPAPVTAPVASPSGPALKVLADGSLLFNFDGSAPGSIPLPDVSLAQLQLMAEVEEGSKSKAAKSNPSHDQVTSSSNASGTGPFGWLPPWASRAGGRNEGRGAPGGAVVTSEAVAAPAAPAVSRAGGRHEGRGAPGGGAPPAAASAPVPSSTTAVGSVDPFARPGGGASRGVLAATAPATAPATATAPVSAADSRPGGRAGERVIAAATAAAGVTQAAAGASDGSGRMLSASFHGPADKAQTKPWAKSKLDMKSPVVFAAAIAWAATELFSSRPGGGGSR